MRALELDFQRRPRPSVFGWAILVIALLTLAGFLSVHRTLAEQTALHRATVKRVDGLVPGAGTSRAGNPVKDARLETARQVLERSKLPWTDLFSALESTDDKDVAVLALTPDLARSQLKIHAEARHLAAMLAFHRRLQQADGLSQVVLVDHVVSKDSPETPVRFHILAAWGGNRGRP